MRKRYAAVVGLLIGALAPAVVWAQVFGGTPQSEAERRPFRGLFSGLSTPNTPQSLVLSGSLFGAYDDNVLAELTGGNVRDWRLQRSGVYGGAHAALNYAIARDGERISFGAQTGGQLRYYRNADLSNVAPHYHAGANLRIALSRSTSLTGTHQFTYSRHYRLFLPPTGVDGVTDDPSILANPDVDLLQLPALRNSTQVALSQNIGRRASLSVGYGLRAVDFLEDAGSDLSDEAASNHQLKDYRSQSLTARFQYSRPLTAHATVNLGYGIRTSDSRSVTGEPPILHHVTAGVSYSRALSFSRRTSVSFSTGSAVAMSDQLNRPEAASRAQLRVIGNAALIHDLGRTWTARVSYHRGFTFQEGFDEPYFTDGVSAGLAGLVTRRLSFSAMGAWALSELDRPGRTGHTTFMGTAQSTYALHSLFALYAQYLYYTFDFGAEVPLDPRFPRALDRSGVRAGITASVPLLR
jgi:hypothetical protein